MTWSTYSKRGFGRRGFQTRRTATALLLLLLASLPLAALAAEPAAPERLPSEAIGVVGSGDQLDLQLRQDGVLRTIRLGQEYRDGWSLKSLTATLAVLAKGGEVKEVGLNPSGAVAKDPEGGGAVVTVLLTAEDAVRLSEAVRDGAWDGKALPNLTMEETQRRIIYNRKVNEFLAGRNVTAMMDAYATPDGRMAELSARPRIMTAIRDLLGPEALADLQTLARKSNGFVPEVGNAGGRVYVQMQGPGFRDRLTAAAEASGFRLPEWLSLNQSPMDASGGTWVTPATPAEYFTVNAALALPQPQAQPRPQ